MNLCLYLFCRVVVQLNRIPRYGRYYRLRPEGLEQTARWAWSQNGRWGWDLLDRMGLFWDYLDESQARHARKQRFRISGS